jgi:hypothetical protein
MDHVDLKAVHAIHPVHHLDAENRFLVVFSMADSGMYRKGAGAGGQAFPINELTESTKSTQIRHEQSAAPDRHGRTS